MLTRKIVRFGNVTALSIILVGAAMGQQVIKNAIPEVARPLPLTAVRLTGSA